jgi:hypothetical protein
MACSNWHSLPYNTPAVGVLNVVSICPQYVWLSSVCLATYKCTFVWAVKLPWYPPIFRDGQAASFVWQGDSVGVVLCWAGSAKHRLLTPVVVRVSGSNGVGCVPACVLAMPTREPRLPAALGSQGHVDSQGGSSICTTQRQLIRVSATPEQQRGGLLTVQHNMGGAVWRSTL